MKKILKMVALAGAVFAFSGSELWAITVTNGGFEDPGLVTGWNTVDNGDMLLISGATPYGSQHLEIGGFGGGVQNSIDQLVGGFTPTLIYRVTFSIASQWANQDGSSGAQVEISFPSGSSTGSQVFTAPAVANWLSWQTYTYDFVATAASVDVQFMQITNGFDDVGIDNISIEALLSLPRSHSAGWGSLGVGLAALRREVSTRLTALRPKQSLQPRPAPPRSGRAFLFASTPRSLPHRLVRHAFQTCPANGPLVGD